MSMLKNVSIIGISGTNGAGKDAVGQILVKEYNFYFISVTDLLRSEAKRLGFSIDRSTCSQISSEWRRQYGLAVLIDKAMEQYQNLSQQYNGVVISSLRNPAEADQIHRLNGIVLWIDADLELRYKRLQKNLHQRARQVNDDKTFQEFMEEEQAEMINTTSDPARLNTLAVKAKSDFFIDNNSYNINDLVKSVKDIME